MEDCRLKSPFTCLVAGGTGCGKSTLVKNIIERHKEVFDHTPTKIYIAHAHKQSIYERLTECAPCAVELVEGLPDKFSTEPGSLLIIDDLAADYPKQIKDWHVRKSHHLLTDVITIVQNLFDKNPVFRSVSLNSHYIIVHKNPRDSSQITHLAKQISPSNTRYFVEAYKDSTKEP